MKISEEISRSLGMKMLEMCLAELHKFMPRSLPLWTVHFFQMSPTLIKKQGKGPCTGLDIGTEQAQVCSWENQNRSEPSNEQTAK